MFFPVLAEYHSYNSISNRSPWAQRLSYGFASTLVKHECGCWSWKFTIQEACCCLLFHLPVPQGVWLVPEKRGCVWMYLCVYVRERERASERASTARTDTSVVEITNMRWFLRNLLLNVSLDLYESTLRSYIFKFGHNFVLWLVHRTWGYSGIKKSFQEAFSKGWWLLSRHHHTKSIHLF